MGGNRRAYRDLLLGHGGDAGLPGALEGSQAPAGIEGLFARLDELADGGLGEVGGSRPLDAEASRTALLGFAPQAVIVGCWLAPLVKVRGSHRELGAACLDALFDECGAGDAALHRGNLFLAHVASRGTHAGGPEELGRDPRLREADFALAVTSLRMARLDEGFAPELLGYHAATIVLGPPACVQRADAGRFVSDRARGSDGGARARGLAARCLAALEPPEWGRVFHGAMIYARARREFDRSLEQGVPVKSPWEAAREVVASKARAAARAHGAREVGGVRLDDLLAGDASEALAALARSRWVKPGSPDESPLLGELVSFGGPMFGVFTADELGVLRRWVTSLVDPSAPSPPSAGNEGHVGAVLHDDATHTAPRSRRVGTGQTGGTEALSQVDASRWSAPQLYRALLLATDGGYADALARAHVARELERVEHEAAPERLRDVGLWPASAGALGAWVDERMGAQAREGRSGLARGPLGGALSTDDVLWLLTQLAPAAYIDGAWLEGVTAPGCALTAERAALLRIYRDELGAGVTAWHHGNVLRAALAACGVALPDVDDEAFTTACLPEAYALPALWLAFARCSRERLPELLGFNLAIEMAGVGSDYLTMRDMLDRHGIDATFFRLHNSIDNAASGHTAWSCDAATAWLRRAEGLGPAAVDEAMLRMMRGHALYAAINRPLQRAVALRLLPRVGRGLWRKTLDHLRARA